MTPATYTPADVLVIGAGNAAANAALAAHEAGASVAMLETAPQESRGGNSAFTGGAFRFVYDGVDDLLALAPDIKDLDLATIDFGTSTEGQYFDDMGRLTEYRCDPDLTEVLIGNSYQSAVWLRKHGVRFQPALGRQAFKVDACRVGTCRCAGAVRHHRLWVAARRRAHPGRARPASWSQLRASRAGGGAGLRWI
jgi:tricarballylate dehydrogenase